MDGDSRPYWIITAVLVLLAALFALIETTFTHMGKTENQRALSSFDVLKDTLSAMYIIFVIV